MSAVKGSKQYKLEVVPYRPLYRWSIRLLILVVAVAVIVGSYYSGHFEGTAVQREAITERDQLRIEIETVRTAAAAHRQQVANLEMGSKVDQQANEGVRQEVIELKEKIAGLEEDISFYKGLMSPTANKRGLTIGSLNVLDTDVPGRYSYKLVLQQLATNHKLINGYLNMNVVGRQNGRIVSLPLKELNDKVSYENIKLRFKYFQNFSGELTLPKGFEPIRIELLAKSTGRNSVTVREKFGWLVQNTRADARSHVKAIKRSQVARPVQVSKPVKASSMNKLQNARSQSAPQSNRQSGVDKPPIPLESAASSVAQKENTEQ